MTDPVRTTAPTRVALVMQAVRSRIDARALGPGGRVPSVRAAARALGVSKSTAVEAYERLVAEGTITARRGSGFYVAPRGEPLSLAPPGPRRDRAVDPLWITRQSLDAGSGTAIPGCGWLPPDWLPREALSRALRQALRGGADMTGYGTPLGHPALRRHLSRQLAERGIASAPDRIVLAASGTQAIDLVLRLLLEPGDTVLVDDPCYFNFHAMLRAHRAQVVGVPFRAGGPDLDAFAAALRRHRPRLYLTNGTIQNPTGASLSPVTAHRLLRLAEDHDLLIVEDDIFADFETGPVPRLAALDGLARVIHVGSFSKTLSAAMRCGFIAGKGEWIEPLVDLKLTTTFGADPVAAEMVYLMLSQGAYRRHVHALRARLADAMGLTLNRLERAGLSPWVRPAGGFFIWAALPEGVAAAAVAAQALAEDVVLAPGDAFSPSPQAGGFMRFNVAQCADPATFDVLARAMERSLKAR